MPLVATSGSVDIADGVYPATILAIALTPATPNSPSDQPWLKWTIQVWSGGEGIELSAGSSTKFGPKSKTRQWVEAVLERKFATGESFAYEEFAPKDAQVIVKKDEQGFCRVVDVLGMPKRPPLKKSQEPEVGVVV
jgi:hypothetical protein